MSSASATMMCRRSSAPRSQAGQRPEPTPRRRHSNRPNPLDGGSVRSGGPLPMSEMARVRNEPIHRFGGYAKNSVKNSVKGFKIEEVCSEWQDLRLRPPRPERGALPATRPFRSCGPHGFILRVVSRRDPGRAKCGANAARAKSTRARLPAAERPPGGRLCRAKPGGPPPRARS